MFYFQLPCAKKFQPKNEFFCTASKYGMPLLICKRNLEKIIGRKYRRATPEIQVFFMLRCLKMHH